MGDEEEGTSVEGFLVGLKVGLELSPVELVLSCTEVDGINDGYAVVDITTVGVEVLPNIAMPSTLDVDEEFLSNLPVKRKPRTSPHPSRKTDTQNTADIHHSVCVDRSSSSSCRLGSVAIESESPC